MQLTAACSKVGSFAYSQYFTLYVDLTESISGNVNTVTYNVYCKSSGSGSINAKHALYFELGGQVFKNETVQINVSSPNAFIQIASGTKQYTYDGDFQVWVGAYIKASSYGVSAEIGQVVNLTRINRYANFTSLSVSSRTSSSVKLAFTSDAACKVYVSTNGGASWLNSGNPYIENATSGTVNVTGLSANTTYNFYVLCRHQASGLDTGKSISATTFAKTTPTISLSSKTSSSITVTSGCNVTVSSTQYRIKTSSGSYGNYQTSATFSGLSANTAYVVEVKKVGQDSGESGTATLSVTTYAKTTPTISLSSKSVNSIVVTSGCNVTVSSTEYRIKTSSGSYGSYQTSATFSNLNPNTAYVVEVKKVGSDSKESGTATLSVTTYNIATMSAATNFDLGGTHSITYSNPMGSSIGALDACLSFTGELDDIGYRAVSKTGTSYTYTFTDAELDKLYKKYGTGNTITVTSYLRTTHNSKSYHSTKDITITLKGNQKTSHINVNGSWKRGKMWINDNGTWKRAVMWTNVNGTWKRTI